MTLFERSFFDSVYDTGNPILDVRKPHQIRPNRRGTQITFPAPFGTAFATDIQKAKAGSPTENQ